MCILKGVTPSGTVGKQVYAATAPAEFCGVILTAATSAATVVVRDGNASGEVVLTMKSGVNNSITTPGDVRLKMLKGMHVKVTPADALAYLLIS